jgi:hypothetical protein
VWSKSEREQALEDVDSRLNRLRAKGVRNGHVIAVGSAKGGTGRSATVRNAWRIFTIAVSLPVDWVREKRDGAPPPAGRTGGETAPAGSARHRAKRGLSPQAEKELDARGTGSVSERALLFQPEGLTGRRPPPHLARSFRAGTERAPAAATAISVARAALDGLRDADGSALPYGVRARNSRRLSSI